MAYIILIAGCPAAGKTTYAGHIAEKLHIPLIVKDNVKEKMSDGTTIYSVLYHIAECLMKANTSFILESNFTKIYSVNDLLPLVQKYNYHALTVLLDADAEVLLKRFTEREIERHPELKSQGYAYVDAHNADASLYRDFCVGEKITVDTTDFAKVNYDEIDTLVLNFIKNLKG